MTEAIRPHCSLFWVDVRARRIEDVWVASADTPDGPTIAASIVRKKAIREALEPFADVRDELMSGIS